MVLFWGKKNDPKEEDTSKTNEDGQIPDDLANYLETKESQLSNREFKALLRRQSANVEEAKKTETEDVEQNGTDFLNMLTHKGTNQDNNKTVEENIPKLPMPISTSSSMRRPKEYEDYQLDKYRRENDEKESVLTNCAEIQGAFYKCLGEQKIWDRVASVARLESDECTKLAEFFMACTDIQKKAFLMFDYASLESISEMQGASKRIDKTFNDSFKNVDDVTDKEKFLNYTKELRNQREDFFMKFNK